MACDDVERQRVHRQHLRHVVLARERGAAVRRRDPEQRRLIAVAARHRQVGQRRRQRRGRQDHRRCARPRPRAGHGPSAAPRRRRRLRVRCPTGRRRPPRPRILAQRQRGDHLAGGANRLRARHGAGGHVHPRQAAAQRRARRGARPAGRRRTVCHGCARAGADRGDCADCVHHRLVQTPAAPEPNRWRQHSQAGAPVSLGEPGGPASRTRGVRWGNAGMTRSRPGPAARSCPGTPASGTGGPAGRPCARSYGRTRPSLPAATHSSGTRLAAPSCGATHPTPPRLSAASSTTIRERVLPRVRLVGWRARRVGMASG